jgi:hypothetical protein
MKDKTLTGLGIGACAAACAAGFLVPALMTGGAAGLAAWFSISGADILMCTALAAALGGAAYLIHRRRKAAACAADNSCGCAASGGKGGSPGS